MAQLKIGRTFLYRDVLRSPYEMAIIRYNELKSSDTSVAYPLFEAISFILWVHRIVNLFANILLICLLYCSLSFYFGIFL